MNEEALLIFQRFIDYLHNIQTDVVDADKMNLFSKLLHNLEEMNASELPKVLWIDEKNKFIKPNVHTLSITTLENLPKDLKDLNDFPPPHHLWVYCCSHIKAHSVKTADILKWLQRNGQAGLILVYGTEDPEQTKKADSVLYRSLMSEGYIYFFSVPEAGFDIFTRDININITREKAPARFVKAFVSHYYELLEQLKKKIVNNANSVDGVTKIIQSNINTLESKKDSLTSSIKTTIDMLREEIPDFNWLESLMLLAPDIEEILSEEDIKRLKEEDKSEEEPEEEDNKNPDEPEKKSEDEETKKQDKTEIKHVENTIKKETLRAIVEHFETLQIPHLNKEDIRIMEEDTVLNSTLVRISGFLKTDLLTFDLSSEEAPMWLIDKVEIVKITEKAFREVNLPHKIVMQIIKFISMIRIRGGLKAVAIFTGIKLILDNWGSKIYINVLNEVEDRLMDFNRQHQMWIDGLIEKIESQTAFLKNYAQRLETGEDILISFKKTSHFDK